MDSFPAPPMTQGYSLRKAVKADLDDITRIHIIGFVEEPMDNYCYPLRFKYKDDHFKWMKKEYEYYLDNPQKYLVHVADAPDKSKSAPKPMAIAVWNIAVLADAPALDRGLDERKDANKIHVEAYVKVASKRYKPHGVLSKWGDKQITLSVLTVLPDFRLQGVGTMMVNWGIKAAAEKQWPVDLCASPMGQLLYAHLKFQVIDTEKIQADGEKESFSSAVMVLYPSKESQY